MKPRKHLVVAGAAPADVSEIGTFMRVAQTQLDHAWRFAKDDDEIDFVLTDLTDFGGRCARVRALDEGKHFAVIANAGDDVLGADLVLHRPFSAKAIVGLLNHVGRAAPPEPRRLIDFSAVERRIVPQTRKTKRQDDEEKDAGPESTRASFIDVQRERRCTDLDALVKRGAVLVQRHGIPPLLIDPVTDTFHTSARLVELEPYFLEPLGGHERKRVGGAQLAELRKQHPGRPLVRLRWLHAFLRSNGWLAAHLDPSASYKLKRWLPLDNDYRKQHRIALTLMREAPLHEIARAAKAKMADVFDVVNAYDALGLIETRRLGNWDPSPETIGKRKRSTRKTQRLLAATVFTR
ncbi:hypothetical protein EV148_102443 [Dokdonella fugitiva]|uniref:Uncharacterized protein n=1 Tax=Dokdonella fugitiva TaxID=328517 RepID=A0A4R2IC21_9GAMM|nr:hypothetical protein EV148_102443 [Dokdonella fugitiva]